MNNETESQTRNPADPEGAGVFGLIQNASSLLSTGTLLDNLLFPGPILGPVHPTIHESLTPSDPIPEPKWESVTLEANNIVHCARRDDYGDAYINCAKTAALWSAYLGVPIAARDVPMMMILVKISRELTGGSKRDNRVDMAGYAEVLEMVERAEKER